MFRGKTPFNIAMPKIPLIAKLLIILFTLFIASITAILAYARTKSDNACLVPMGNQQYTFLDIETGSISATQFFLDPFADPHNPDVSYALSNDNKQVAFFSGNAEDADYPKITFIDVDQLSIPETQAYLATLSGD